MTMRNALVKASTFNDTRQGGTGNGAAYFLYIPNLEKGDIVTITNLWETLTYEVVDWKIITPYDVESIHIQPNRDLITLLTCHPPATGGRERYLVFCERIQTELEVP